MDGIGNVSRVADSGNETIRYGVPVPPTLTSGSTANVYAGQSFSYTATFSNSPTSYSASSLPAGLSINTSTGVISGTPTETGVYVVTLEATNGLAGGSGTLTLTVAIGTPGPPTGLSVVTGDGKATISFSAPANTGESAVTGYTATATPSSGLPITATGTSSPITVTGLSDGTVYTFIVVATNGTGNGAASLPSGEIVPVKPYTFGVLAGAAGTLGSTDGTGNSAKFDLPYGAAVDGAGNAYVADTGNSTIRKITSGGVVTTLAGSPGVTGSVDGTGSAARFYNPYGLAVDTSGNVYVADTYNETIRKITPAGVVTTLAGQPGVSGASDGTGSAAQFHFPWDVAVDSAGNVYVADTANNTVRAITPGGVVTTLAGSPGTAGSADGTGNVARLYDPRGVAVDSSGNVYVADAANDTVRIIKSGGVVTTLAGSPGAAGASDGAGRAAQFNQPYSVAVDGNGNVYVADSGNDTIRMITSGGVVTTLAGSSLSAGSTSGTGSVVRFSGPSGLAVDSAGSIYVADTNNHIIRWGAVAPPALISAATASGQYGQSFTYTAVFSGALAGPFSASGLPTGLNINPATGLISGTPTANASTYPVTLGAINGAGTGSGALSLVIGSASTPGAPTGVTITPGNGAATVTFNAPTNNGGLTITGYTVTATPSSGSPVTAKGSTSPITVAGLTNGVAYTFAVAATNGNGAGISSTAAPAVTPESPPSITTQPQSYSVPAGGNAILSVVATSMGLTYQWAFNGTALTDGNGISGSTTSTLAISNVQSAVTGNYTVTVSTVGGNVTSNVATLSLLAGSSANHFVISTVGGYLVGQTITITNSITYTGTASSLGWSVLLPSGWSFLSSGGSTGDVGPNVGDTKVLDWAWTTPPASPVTFTYTLNVPANTTGAQSIQSLVILRLNGGDFQTLAQPDPLVINPSYYHSADENQTGQISLLDLTRVIELYNTHNGTTRTGAYLNQAGTEDGFAPDPTRTLGQAATLGYYHSADEGQVGYLSLTDLTRVIELYNYHNGTARTGDYHDQPGTEDGFAPGP